MTAAAVPDEPAAVSLAGRRLTLLRPLAVRSFRYMWIGETVSLLGDAFYFVALAWLTLQLTGSALALGSVLLASAVPRGILMTVGGAVSDRLTPRLVMLGTNLIRAVLVAVLTFLVAGNAIQLWELYVIAFIFGCGSAFFYPAMFSMVPVLLEEDQMPGGNALMQMNEQVTALVGPAVAGVLIALAGRHLGSSVAFGFDAASFAFAALMLVPVRPRSSISAPTAAEPSEPGEEEGGIVAAIKAGARYVWHDPVLRTLIFVAAALNFCANGPIEVGFATLAHTRFPQGAAAFGIMLGGFGGGGLIGSIIGGSISRPRHRGWMLIGLALLFALCLASFAVVPNVAIATAVCAVMAAGAGILNVVTLTWLQTRTDPRMMGRVMSLVMFASMGLSPVSLAVSGALADVSVTLLFSLAGGAMLLAALASTASRTVRTFD